MTVRLLLLMVLLPVATGCATIPRPGRSSGGPPSTFAKTTADARTTRRIDVREGLAKAQAWRLLGEALADYTVDVRDQQAGFMMTSWEAAVTREGVPDVRYRTRVVTRFLGDDWKQLQLRVEANWRGEGDEWDVGVDQALLEKVETALITKLGKRATP